MMAELRPIRDRGVIPTPMHWQLQEVLSLTRWHNPEKPNRPPFDPGPTGRSGHQIRLFVCAILLRAKTDLGNADVDLADDASLANGLASARLLGDEPSMAVARFLTWLFPLLTDRWEAPPLTALALLILATCFRTGRFADAELGEIADWVFAEESDWRWRQGIGPDLPGDPCPAPFGVGCGFWRPLADELHREAAFIAPEDVRTRLQVCALMLEP
jgi:hypothetical protein